MDSVIEQLKGLKSIKPRAEWVSSSRELLLSQISAQSENVKTSRVSNVWFFTKSIMPSGVLRFVAQPVGIICALLAVVVGTGVLGVNASKTSLPGDLLYPVKLTTERVSISLTIDESKKAEKHLEYAAERVKEIEAVSVQELAAQEKKDKIKQVVSDLVGHMEGAQVQLDKVKAGTDVGQNENKIIVEVALGVDKKAEELSQKLAAKKEEYKEDKEMETVLSEAQATTNQTGVKAVEVVINGVEKSKVELPTKEIMNVIQKKIENTAATVEEMKQSIKDVGAKVNETKVAPAATEPTSVAQPVDVIVEIKDKPAEASSTLSEAQDLLNQGDLTKAIERIKTTVDITNEVKETVNKIEATLVSPAPVASTPTETTAPAAAEEKVNTDVIIKPTN